ncbi:hypothetical protein SAMN06264364_14911 [Quadrisphaera granulorum]|uniref:Uncharacterized protein n=1 Tax=Quadrisphaera granulorum TaxID=317664 RepID=A0A315ZKY3_9ACTN|nr:hypothetical protein [Quadrisphaera granulorum]PWJ46275.1 hypothetical protein BXY45_14911 [Quadrisphaera granulorum]SZE99090.1 hypothetical protein SAMN06264364_14911 [Quadrisphaera granulorum]
MSAPEGAMVLTTITITRLLMPDGGDVVSVLSEDSNGEMPSAIERLGLLAMATDEVLHPEPETDEENN